MSAIDGQDQLFFFRKNVGRFMPNAHQVNALFRFPQFACVVRMLIDAIGAAIDL